MILPVIISTKNRLTLLKQALESLRKNSYSELEIIVVDDNSTDGTQEYLASQADAKVIFLHHQTTIPEVKKKGFELASKDKYVYFSDDDVYFEPGWDIKLISILEEFPDIGIIGGRHHPHHKVFSVRESELGNILISEQQAGYSIMLRQEDYLAIGGYEVSERTSAGGEDTLICDMIKEKGKLVAGLFPPVIVHCGLINHRGLKTADYDEIMRVKSERPEIIFA